ncbi:MAG: phage/plasmid primase, P4 family [Oscillospiraceae bacterium]|nr:phage/plasmid primase, P4 family [Oscillospiraceae bacterium]
MSNNELKKIFSDATLKVKEIQETPVRNFSKNESKNLVHGSNVTAYLNELSPTFIQRLKERKKSIKSKVLFYSTDDAGNIDCFLDMFGDYVIYNSDKGKYYYWTGRLWREDIDNKIQLWVQTSMRTRRDYTLKQLKKNSGVKNYDELLSHVNRCCNQHSIKAVIEGAKATLSFNDVIFDKHPHLLNVLNGTINLKDGVIRPHDRRNFITKLIPIMYDASNKSPQFKSFLKDTFEDDELIKYVQRLLGYCVTGETKEQVVHFFIGNGANGKSTLLSLVQYIMCDYSAVIPSKVLISVERAGAASSEIAQLPHKRLVCCSELNCTDVLNEGKIKIMSSGETLAARQLYSQAFTFEPEFKCIVDTNYLPQIMGTDNGIWRRVRVVPFEYTVSKDKLNKNLLNELKQAKKAVLAWLVKGAIKYYEEGLGTCEAVIKATKKYRKSQDTLGGFIDACIKYEDGSEVRARALYEAYISYCNDNFLNPMSETKFGKDFAALGFKRGKDKVSRKYLGIKLKI